MGCRLDRKFSKGTTAAAILVAGAIKIALKIGLGAGIGTGVGMAEVAASKNQPWDEEFKKAYVEGCLGSFENVQIKDQQKNQVCSCLSDGTESAHILPTKYLASRSNESVLQEYGELSDKFAESPEGKALTSRCLEQAGLSNTNENRIPASHPDAGS